MTINFNNAVTDSLGVTIPRHQADLAQRLYR
jgi:hypothetical protein